MSSRICQIYISMTYPQTIGIPTTKLKPWLYWSPKPIINLYYLGIPIALKVMIDIYALETGSECAMFRQPHSCGNCNVDYACLHIHFQISASVVGLCNISLHLRMLNWAQISEPRSIIHISTQCEADTGHLLGAAWGRLFCVCNTALTLANTVCIIGTADICNR